MRQADNPPDDATREALIAALAAVVLADPCTPWRYPETRAERSNFIWAALALDLAKMCDDGRLRFTAAGWEAWSPTPDVAALYTDLHPDAGDAVPGS